MASSRGALVTVGQVGSYAEQGLRTISLTSVVRDHRTQQRALGTLGRCPLSWGGVGSLHLTLTCVSRCGDGVPGDPVCSPWVWELVFSHNCPCSSLQLSCYDQAKQLVLSTGYLSDNIFTHFVSSFIAVSAPA